MLGRMPTTTLLERVEQHINRLDRALKESEDLLISIRRVDRGDWIRLLHERLSAHPTSGEGEAPAEAPAQPFYRS